MLLIVAVFVCCIVVSCGFLLCVVCDHRFSSILLYLHCCVMIVVVCCMLVVIVDCLMLFFV